MNHNKVPKMVQVNVTHLKKQQLTQNNTNSDNANDTIYLIWLKSKKE